LIGQKGVRARCAIALGVVLMQYQGCWRFDEDIESSADPHLRDKLYHFAVGTRDLTVDASPMDGLMPAASAAAASSSSSEDEGEGKRKNPLRGLPKLSAYATGPAWQAPNQVAEFMNDYRKNIEILDHRVSNDINDINVSFMNVEICGKPAVFVVSTRAIANNEWVRICYGRKYWKTIRERQDTHREAKEREARATALTISQIEDGSVMRRYFDRWAARERQKLLALQGSRLGSSSGSGSAAAASASGSWYSAASASGSWSSGSAAAASAASPSGAVRDISPTLIQTAASAVSQLLITTAAAASSLSTAAAPAASPITAASPLSTTTASASSVSSPLITTAAAASKSAIDIPRFAPLSSLPIAAQITNQIIVVSVSEMGDIWEGHMPFYFRRILSTPVKVSKNRLLLLYDAGHVHGFVEILADLLISELDSAARRAMRWQSFATAAYVFGRVCRFKTPVVWVGSIPERDRDHTRLMAAAECRLGKEDVLATHNYTDEAAVVLGNSQSQASRKSDLLLKPAEQIMEPSKPVNQMKPATSSSDNQMKPATSSSDNQMRPATSSTDARTNEFNNAPLHWPSLLRSSGKRALRPRPPPPVSAAVETKASSLKGGTKLKPQVKVESASASAAAAASPRVEDGWKEFQSGLAYQNRADALPENMRSSLYCYAADMYRTAAMKGVKVAQYNLGLMYFHGKGLAVDESQAFLWFRRAADQKLVNAEYIVGICYQEGRGIKRDLVKAVEFYERAANPANGNLFEAQIRLGDMYRYGGGLVQDDATSFKWYKLAADQGDASAMARVAHCYQQGEGTSKNEASATEYRDDANAAFLLMDEESDEDEDEEGDEASGAADYKRGVAFEYGKPGIGINLVSSFQWYLKSAEKGFAEGEYALALSYENGIGVAKNPVKAFEFHTKAAAQECTDAQYSLGRCYETGRGTKMNKVEAAKWFLVAAELEDVDAENKMGECFEDGIGVRKNWKHAITWYARAAHRQHADAQYNLGALLSRKGEEKKAQEWFRLAAAQNQKDAIARLVTNHKRKAIPNHNAGNWKANKRLNTTDRKMAPGSLNKKESDDGSASSSENEDESESESEEDSEDSEDESESEEDSEDENDQSSGAIDSVKLNVRRVLWNEDRDAHCFFCPKCGARRPSWEYVFDDGVDRRRARRALNNHRRKCQGTAPDKRGCVFTAASAATTKEKMKATKAAEKWAAKMKAKAGEERVKAKAAEEKGVEKAKATEEKAKTKAREEKAKTKATEEKAKTKAAEEKAKAKAQAVEEKAKAKAAEEKAKVKEAQEKAKSAEGRAKVAVEKAKAAEQKAKSAEEKAKSKAAEEKAKAKSAEEKAKAAEEKAKAAEEKAKAAEQKAEAAEKKAKAAEEKAKAAEEKANTKSVKEAKAPTREIFEIDDSDSDEPAKKRHYDDGSASEADEVSLLSEKRQSRNKRQRIESSDSNASSIAIPISGKSSVVASSIAIPSTIPLSAAGL
jgi:TPR repeat protein